MANESELNKLQQWQRQRRHEGTWDWIVQELNEDWSERWLKDVFAGKRKPGLQLFLAIKQLTGLQDEDIIEAYNERN